MKNTLTVEELRHSIETLESLEVDAAMRQTMEKGVWRYVLKVVAGGSPNSRELASEALTLEKIENSWDWEAA